MMRGKWITKRSILAMILAVMGPVFALLSQSATASSITADLGELAYDVTVEFGRIGIPHDPGSVSGFPQLDFWDEWDFTTSGAGNLDVTFGPTTVQGEDSLEVTVINLNTLLEVEGVFNVSNSSWTFYGLDVGAYTLEIFGSVADAFETGGYTGGLTLTQVPLPAAAWLFGSAIMGLTLVARRRNQRLLTA